MNLDDYHFRKSFYSLVELSLLAKMYLENCLPLANDTKPDLSQLPQTLLMMKSTEQRGQLEVAIHGSDPVGFSWQYDGKLMALFVLPEHRGRGVEDHFRARLQH